MPCTRILFPANANFVLAGLPQIARVGVSASAFTILYRLRARSILQRAIDDCHSHSDLLFPLLFAHNGVWRLPSDKKRYWILLPISSKSTATAPAMKNWRTA